MLSPPIASPFEPSSKKVCVAEPPIVLRSPTTARPVLGGNVPGVTVTVRRVDDPEVTEFGLAAPTPDGLVEEPVMVTEILQLPVRTWASVIVAGIVLRPDVVAGATVAWYEKILSPAIASPFIPSSRKVCDAERPVIDRSAVTARPVLGGVVTGVTVTVRSVMPPGATVLGLAAPTPLGLVDVGLGANATPRKAVFAAAVANNIGVPVNAPLYPLESTREANSPPPAAPVPPLRVM